MVADVKSRGCLYLAAIVAYKGNFAQRKHRNTIIALPGVLSRDMKK